MRRGILKRAICALEGRRGRWTSKCDNIRGASIIVSLKRDENLQVGWLTGGDNSVSNRFNNIVCVARFLVSEDHKTF